MADFKDKVIYQIYTKSFMDSNGSGLGDIRGVTMKLDYLKKLGIDYIWLTPFFKSPLNDNGYDVADYLSIDSNFGTMEDVETLIAEADRRGIGLMFDMVFNHTSTQHAWFKRALAGEKKYQDYYIFREGSPDTPPTNWISKFGGSAWKYVPALGKWYLHLFDETQADLNWENPQVREELKKVILFWKNKGVKGFRFDVVNLISKPVVLENDDSGDGRRFYTDGPHIHEFLKELTADTGIDTMVTVGEMSSTSLKNCLKYTNPQEKELSMVFNFHHLKVDYKGGDKWEVAAPNLGLLKELFRTWQGEMQKHNGWNAVFWCNHDQPRAVSRFGDDKKYWKQSAKMLAVCTHLMRGTPYIFQGEELGMTNPGYTSINSYRDVESLNYYDIMLKNGKTEEEALDILSRRSRDNGRTPMQWSGAKNAGFSTGTPWIALPGNYQTINAEAELADSDSVFYFYQKLIALRKEMPVIADGRIEFLYPEEKEVIAYRRYDDADELLVLCNFTDREHTLCLPEAFADSKTLLANYPDRIVSNEEITLRAYEAVVLAMGK